MPLLDREDLNDILKRYSGVISMQLAVRVGSQVYGTAQEASDTDFAVIGLENKDSELLFGTDYNVTLFSKRKMIQALREHSVFAFEILHAPPEHRLYEHKLYDQKIDLPYTFDPKKLASSSISKSDADWKKGLKLIGYETPKAQKRLWHSLRVLMFACQLLETQSIYDFTVANHWFEEIMTDPSEDSNEYEQWLGPIRDELCHTLLSS